MLLIIMLIAVVVLDIAALRWGVDSRDDMDSAEWERRLNWNLAYPPEYRQSAYTYPLDTRSEGRFAKAALN